MMEIINVHTEKCGTFTVYVQGTKPKKAPVLLTVPDLGCNHEQLSSFVDRFLHGRYCWFHVELPGQAYGAQDWRPDADPSQQVFSEPQPSTGRKASDSLSPSGGPALRAPRRFSITASGPSFPTMQDLATGILTIFEKLELFQVILIGEGSGANLLSRVVILDNSRVLGLVLIHGRCTPSGPLQRLREKMKSSSDTKLDGNTEKYLLEHRFSATTNSNMSPEMKKQFALYRSALATKVNPRNLNQLIYCYAHRKTLADTVNRIECPILLISGSLSDHRSNVRNMYEIINKAKKSEGKNFKIAEIIEIVDCVSPLIETPDKVADSITYFLQGLGLVGGKGTATISASPSDETAAEADVKMAALARSVQRQMSMAELDLPRGPGAFSAANWHAAETLQHTAASGREHGY